MGDLSKNLSRREVACKCGCGYDTIDAETVAAFQETCDHFAKILGVKKVVADIHSAARCLEWNRTPISLGGPGSNDNSQHPKGRAIDFSIRGVSPSDLYAYLVTRYPDRYGIGRYSWGVHLDTATGGSRSWG